MNERASQDQNTSLLLEDALRLSLSVSSSSSSEDNPIPIIGYCDRFSVEPAESVRFMVSSDHPRYRAEIVRLIHGSADPRGPGLKEERVVSGIEGEYQGVAQAFPKGSYVVFQDKSPFRLADGFSFQAWILPTTLPAKGIQAIICAAQFELSIDQGGRLMLVLKGGGSTGETISGDKPLVGHYWYFVACAYDPRSRRVLLHWERMGGWSDETDRETVEQEAMTSDLNRGDTPTLIAAAWRSRAGKLEPSSHFNGKIDGPRVFSRALGLEEMRRRSDAAAQSSSVSVEDVAAAWDFASKVETDDVLDASPHGRHGKTVNSPKRAVTGHNWSGREQDYRRAPNEYGAIHFHDDDLDNARWKVAFEYRVPDGMKSGAYAAKLMSGTGDDVDYVPFFVRPRRGTASAKIAFLAPTLSYMAYANDHSVSDPQLQKALGLSFAYPIHRIDRYLVRNNLLSLYDKHTDGSGVCYVSRLRPILTMRPDYREPGLWDGKGSPHQFSADLCLLDWLEAKGFEYDIITDEDLHREGSGLLAPYRVVLTGSHPEYWTEQMLAAMDRYLNEGGRLMYLGGNGFYWVTSVDPNRPHTFEVRRWGGTQSWTSDPGEYHHSGTGELGGLWRNRGRAPQKMLGVGFTAQGFDHNQPYTRLPGSLRQEASFIFEGIGKDELIGDFDCLIQGSGAGGYEVDRLDSGLGSPPGSIRLATAMGFSDSYQHVIEEIGMMGSREGGTMNELVRADMVYLGYPKGGAVFSVGSIAWCGSLFYNKYDNNVSRVTENVLRKFSSSD